MTTLTTEAFEAKYQRSADDPASAEMFAIWEAAWNTATERAAKKKEREDGIVVAAYVLPSAERYFNEVRVERVSRACGPDQWAIRRNGDVLNKQGEWEWEPMPSSRDNDFLARARFATADEAIDAAIRAREAK